MAVEASYSLQRQHAIVTLAQQAARNAVKRKLQKEGTIRHWLVPAAQITRLADAYLEAHAELYAQAAATPVVQNLGNSVRRRRPDPQRWNSGSQGPGCRN
jgi:hypothetical protein